MGIGAALGGLPSVLLTALGSLSALLAAFSGWWTVMQRREVRRRGTVYIIRESGDLTKESWQDDKGAEPFIAALRQSFPDVRQIPGPATLRGWRWPLGAGAECWDQHLDELMTALRVVRRGDDLGNQQSLVVWARWPVAVATTARLLSLERGPALAIRQRVSFGRSPDADKVDPRQPALTFAPRPAPICLTAARTVDYRGAIRISSRPGSAERLSRNCRNGARNRSSVSVLLIRLTAASWGPLTAPDHVASADDEKRVTLDVEDAAGIGVSGRCDLDMREWRCLPQDRRRGSGSHPWSDFELLAQAAAEWAAKEARRRPERLVLIGTVMPQEIGLGLGVHIHRLGALAWPEHLYPIVWDVGRHRFVIPRLDLGWAALNDRWPGNAQTEEPVPLVRNRSSWRDLVRW
jgi:hypothetical protein